MNPAAAEMPAEPAECDARTRLRSLIDANWTTQAIAVAVRLGLPELLAPGPRPLKALAVGASSEPASLLRLLRALTSIGIVSQEREDGFALTEMGALLGATAPGSMAAWAEWTGTPSWATWGQLRECVRSGHSARKRARGVDGFEHLEQDAQAALLFNRAMVGATRPVAAEVASRVSFAGVERVVDVGGGFGELLTAVLRAHPRMRGVLFDMAHAIKAAGVHLAEAGVAGRCERVTRNFFDAVPAGADAYLLKSILHDWDDARCLSILARCAQAMPPHARLMVVERVMPEHLAVCARDQGIARADLNMLVGTGGQERTLEQYRALLIEAGLRSNTEPLALSGGFSVLSAVRA